MSCHCCAPRLWISQGKVQVWHRMCSQLGKLQWVQHGLYRRALILAPPLAHAATWAAAQLQNGNCTFKAQLPALFLFLI